MHGRFGQDDFERRPDMRLPQMTGEGRTVATAEDCVDVERAAAVRRDRDIANQGGDLDLFLDGNGPVGLRLPVEIFQLRVGERPDG